MMEFADIFAYELTATVYLASSLVVLIALLAATLWSAREPSSGADFISASGL